MKKAFIILFAGCGVFCIVLLGASWHFSNQLMYPKPGICNNEHFVYCEGASQLGIPFEDVEFKNAENLTLKGWYFPAKGSKRAIIMVHGITADRREGLRWVKALHGAGFNLLLFDLRNHGKSDKSPTGMGYAEKHDVIAAVDYLQKVRGLTSIGVFGVSLGGATAIHAMAQDPRIAAGMFEASYAHLADLLAQIAKRDFSLPRFPIIHSVLLVYRLRSGMNPAFMNPEDYIGKIAPRPVYLIHCPKDNYTEFSHGMRLFKAAKEPKFFWEAPCNVHARAWQSNPLEAEKIVKNFFANYVK
ncbi:MAG: alpha/beta hydrolase [Spirochaetes bacterium]|nr:alpha/beta hydrolase [Spirochaetota bacterium]